MLAEMIIPEIKKIILFYLDYIQDKDLIDVFEFDKKEEIKKQWLKNSYSRVLYSTNKIEYTVNGILHGPENSDTPTSNFNDGNTNIKQWYMYGKLHKSPRGNVNVPAIIRQNSCISSEKFEYYINGTQL